MTCRADLRSIFLVLLAAGPAWAQTPAAPSQPAARAEASERRPAVPTFLGVPTAEVLPSGRVSVMASYSNFDERQGVTDVTQYGLSAAVGVLNRLELFGSWRGSQLHRNVDNPFFDPSDPVVGGVSNEFPYLRRAWTDELGGPMSAGVKLNVLSQSREEPMALAAQVTGKFPAGATQASTNDLDLRFDLIGGREISERVEFTGAVGYVLRGDPDEFRLADGVTWGLASAFPSRTPIRALLEVHGEWLMSDQATTVVPLVAEDGSVAPTESRNHDPVRFRAGAVWQPRGGFFVVAGASYTLDLADSIAGRAIGRHPWGMDVRIGFHPGVRRIPPAVASAVAPAPAPPPQSPPAAPAAIAPPPPPPAAPTFSPTPPAAAQAPAPRAIAMAEEVYFDFAQSELRPESRARLDDAAQVLRENSDVRLSIEGHADELGTSEYNLALGERRARSVYDYLVSLGIDGGRLRTLSYGEERPRYDNSTEETRSLNRRAALVILR